MPLVSASTEHSWLSKTGHSWNKERSIAHPIPTPTSPSDYYWYPMQFESSIARYYGRKNVYLSISDRVARGGDNFYLCNMSKWAEHYYLNNPWPFILTAALGIINNRSNDDMLNIDPGLAKKALNPLGIATSWKQDSSWSSCGDMIQESLEKHYPLDGSRNSAFTALAQSSDLHFSSVFYALMSLTETPQDASYLSYM